MAGVVDRLVGDQKYLSSTFEQQTSFSTVILLDQWKTPNTPRPRASGSAAEHDEKIGGWNDQPDGTTEGISAWRRTRIVKLAVYYWHRHCKRTVGSGDRHFNTMHAKMGINMKTRELDIILACLQAGAGVSRGRQVSRVNRRTSFNVNGKLTRRTTRNSFSKIIAKNTLPEK
ncbi:uncharacterized protein BCR38DRAFT_10380 [Pseudomassariella vexata]|uniref:Uncharacterized protein n=1 Tax=Pseudomassariella vexata TaxID=1141098 RepID=A0A1Y2EIL9_9PEZI|nr:uncharacterized protein BCR38DRAFT_10380 [Pseudomassariella vexata]ORY71439.1 hypothetical protein BCR38DRAFT_10380 [Pseudomassariella vexata]